MGRSVGAWGIGLVIMGSGCEAGVLDSDVSDSDESALVNARCAVSPNPVASGATYTVTTEGLSRNRAIRFLIESGFSNETSKTAQ
jgi:hypothetical protein